MKRNKLWQKLMLSMASVTVVAGLAACGNNEPTAVQDENEVTKISLYSGGSLNVKNYWEKVLPMFEDKHPEIDVEFVFVDSGTGGQSSLDRIIAAKKTGKDSEIDILEGGTGDIMRGQAEGEVFLPLDAEAIPNLERIAPENLEGTDHIGLPYRASSVVLAYNEEKVKNPPNSPDELYQWIKDNPERFAYNDPSTGGAGDSFVLTAVYNFLSDEAMNSTDESVMEDWDQGFQLLKDLHPNMYKEGIYPKKNQGTLDLLANGEVDMIPAWSDMALEQINKGLLPETTKLKQLDPAFTGGPTNLMLVDNGDEKRQEAAEKLFGFVLSTEAQEVVVNEMYGYPGIEWEYLSPDMQKNFESVSGGYRTFNGGELKSELWKQWQREVATQ